MRNSEVLLRQIMEAVMTEELLSASDAKSLERLILSKRIKEEDWLTALENTHLKKGDAGDL